VDLCSALHPNTSNVLNVLYCITVLRTIVADVDVLFCRFVDEFRTQPNRGYGGNVITVFEALRRENYRHPYGPAERQFDGNGSYGNGGAMRISPAALFAIKRQPEEVDVILPVVSR